MVRPLHGHFRKACRLPTHAYLCVAPALPAKSRTCFEGPFGEVLRATGPMAKANPFRFSTKYQDDETDLLYYGLRYYNASAGRWMSSDPIEERGGLGLYVFVRNQPLTYYDPHGEYEKAGFEPIPNPTRGGPRYRLVPKEPAKKVPRCEIWIIAGHTTRLPKALTVSRKNKGCAFGEMYGCATGGGVVDDEDLGLVLRPQFPDPRDTWCPSKAHRFYRGCSTYKHGHRRRGCCESGCQRHVQEMLLHERLD